MTAYAGMSCSRIIYIDNCFVIIRGKLTAVQNKKDKGTETKTTQYWKIESQQHTLSEANEHNTSSCNLFESNFRKTWDCETDKHVDSASTANHRSQSVSISLFKMPSLLKSPTTTWEKMSEEQKETTENEECQWFGIISVTRRMMSTKNWNFVDNSLWSPDEFKATSQCLPKQKTIWKALASVTHMRNVPPVLISWRVTW